MSDKTKIEWTDATWNPIRGCSRVSEGCRNCYAERVAARFSGPGQPYEGLAQIVSRDRWKKGEGGIAERREPHWTGEVRFIESVLDAPLHWKKPRMIFVNSMSDLFYEAVRAEWICRIFAVMALRPQHTFQVLTKRPARMSILMNDAHSRRWVQDILEEEFHDRDAAYKLIDRWPLPNVWLGVSVEDQKTADERIPLLLQTPAAVRWVSYEPALGPVDFRPFLYGFSRVSPTHESRVTWIVCGGESGPGARPMHPEWARAIRDQCQAACVPFFFKQWGELLHVSMMPAVFTDHEMEVKTFRCAPPSPGTTGRHMRVGKKRAGRLLDGIEWNEFPSDGQKR